MSCGLEGVLCHYVVACHIALDAETVLWLLGASAVFSERVEANATPQSKAVCELYRAKTQNLHG